VATGLSSLLVSIAAVVALVVSKTPRTSVASAFMELFGSWLSSPGVTLEIAPFQGAGFGAEVSGINLRHAVQSHMAKRLRVALQEHGVLLFRGQRLTQRQVLSAASIFGAPIPAVGQEAALAIYRVKDRDPLPRGQDFWHSDNSYMPSPGGPTMLYSLKVPRGPGGSALGDTLFADAEAAAAQLSPALRVRCEGLGAVHNSMHNGGVPEPEYTSGEWEAREDVVHPVLRVNPLSGREVLFVSPAYVHRIAGVSSDESDGLLGKLFEHLQQPAFIHRHRWEEGDLLVWDNGRLLHKATTLEMPPGAERLMWRVQTVNEP